MIHKCNIFESKFIKFGRIFLTTMLKVMIAKFWLRIDRWLSGNGFHRFIIPVVLAIVAFLAVFGILKLSIKHGCFGFENLKFATDSCRRIGDIGDAAFFIYSPMEARIHSRDIRLLET